MRQGQKIVSKADGVDAESLFTFRSAVPPINLQLEFLGFRLNIPWTGGRYLCIRMHVFRWDAYSKHYIFCSGMAKRVPATEVMP